MGLIDLLCEKVGFGKDDRGDSWVIGLISRAAQVDCLDDRSVLFEETLVVSKMVWVDFEEISDIRETLRARRITDRLSIDGDSDGSGGRSDLRDLAQLGVLSFETDAYHASVIST